MRKAGLNLPFSNFEFVSDFGFREVIAKLQHCREKAQKAQENSLS
jgi:hypothetical protein